MSGAKKKKKFLNEIIILSVLVVAGVLYLVFRPSGSVNYELPSFSELKTAEITKVVWSHDGTETPIVKKGDSWYISDKEYPANASRFSSLLEQLAQPKLSNLLSSKGPYEPYNLDEKNRYSVQAYSGEELVRSLLLGENNNGSYTNVSLPDAKEVYLMRGNVLDALESDISDLRDKKVLSFNESVITSIKIVGLEKTLELNKTLLEGSEEVYAWQDTEGKTYEDELLDNTLSKLSDLYASDFNDTGLSEDAPAYEITLSGDNGVSFSLKVAAEPVEQGYLASSSEYNFPFYLSDYTVGNFLEDFGFIQKTEDA